MLSFGCSLMTSSFLGQGLSNMNAAAGASLNWMRTSALRSSRALPAFMMKGTPAQRGVFTEHLIAANVAVVLSEFTVSSSV